MSELKIKRQFAAFSDAVREGIKMLPAVHGPYIEYDAAGKPCGSCFVGAGMFAADLNSSLDALTAFPYLRSEVACPAQGCHDACCLFDISIRLYEEHGWTREEVLSWLYAEEERLGFVTVLDTQPSCDSRDNDLTQDRPASLPESSLEVSCLKN